MKFHQSPDPSGRQPRTAVPSETLASASVQIERKSFSFSLKENVRGRFLRITEGGKGRQDSIVIPSTGLAEFKRVLDEMAERLAQIPPEEGGPG